LAAGNASGLAVACRAAITFAVSFRNVIPEWNRKWNRKWNHPTIQTRRTPVAAQESMSGWKMWHVCMTAVNVHEGVIVRVDENT